MGEKCYLMLEFRSLQPIYPIDFYKPHLLTHIRLKFPRPLLCEQHQNPQYRVVVELPLISAQQESLEAAARMLERPCSSYSVPPLQLPLFNEEHKSFVAQERLQGKLPCF